MRQRGRLRQVIRVIENPARSCQRRRPGHIYRPRPSQRCQPCPQALVSHWFRLSSCFEVSCTSFAPTLCNRYHRSELDFVVENGHLLARFESRKSNVRASIATKSVTQTAVATTSDLALHSEIDFCQIIRFKLQRNQVLIRLVPLSLVFGFQTGGKTTSTIFAGTSSLGFRFAFSC